MKQSRIALIAISMSVFSYASFADTIEVKADVQVAKPYPTALIERPFTLPAGTIEVGTTFHFKEFAKGDKFNDQFASISRLSAAFGITDDFTVGLSWSGMQLHKEMKPTQSLSLGLGYFIGANDWFATMASLDVPVHFERRPVRNVSFALPTAFNVGVKNVSVLAFYDSLVDFRFGRATEATFNLPLRVGYQVTSSLWLDASTTIARFETGAGLSNKYVWKEPEVRLRGLYAFTNDFDAILEAGFADATKPKETFAVSLGINYRHGLLGA